MGPIPGFGQKTVAFYEAISDSYRLEGLPSGVSGRGNLFESVGGLKTALRD
jgi:hypothetical protein